MRAAHDACPPWRPRCAAALHAGDSKAPVVLSGLAVASGKPPDLARGGPPAAASRHVAPRPCLIARRIRAQARHTFEHTVEARTVSSVDIVTPLRYMVTMRRTCFVTCGSLLVFTQRPSASSHRSLFVA
ncbi:hypothetical protein ACCO45_000906 [Purpureocillium lilacinum]|uniref:Uncharacterized protein n=1 Tax=Purpureocillium lilacinum TaxID=33203 RepID=A0ACC4E6V5_PURLI